LDVGPYGSIACSPIAHLSLCPATTSFVALDDPSLIRLSALMSLSGH
jgi:hypothetical protein